jgi:hypothetical protein
VSRARRLVRVRGAVGRSGLVALAALAALAGPAVLAGRAEAQQPGWEVRVPERIDVVLGEAGVLPIAVAVDRGLAVSRDAPVIVDLAGPGLGLRRTRLGRADAVDPGADAPRFAVALRPTAAGELVAKVRIRLWLCGAQACRPLDVRREAKVVVAAAPEPPASPPPPAAPPAS